MIVKLKNSAISEMVDYLICVGSDSCVEDEIYLKFLHKLQRLAALQEEGSLQITYKKKEPELIFRD